MRNIRTIFPLFFFISCSLLNAAVPHDLSRFFSETESFQRAHIGIYVAEVDTGEEIYALHENQYFVPASLQKIPVSVAAISFLGDEYRFTTELQYEGDIDSRGTLHGNVWIQGGGDPSLSLKIFSDWKEALQKNGINQIDGKIIVDASSFESTLASPYWYFEDLGNYYGAGASGLSMNENFYQITFAPGINEGDPAKVIKIEPEIPRLVIHNEVRTGPVGSGDRVNVFGTEYSPVQFYRGTIPIDEPTFTVKAAMPDPALFCGDFLAQSIQAIQGVEVVREKKDKKKQTTLIRSESKPLKDLIKKMNHESNNLYAEHFCKAIGQGSSQNGMIKIQKVLNDLGIPACVKDGAGLARSNMITPRGFVHLLSTIRNTPRYRSIYSSFPESGNSGTMQSFPHLSQASLRAKTGSMTGIICLGGYITLDSGKEYAFSVFCNQYEGPNRDVKKEMYLFLDHLVKHLSSNLN